MKKIQKKAFSLIELMIVISIMGILMLFTYAPYVHYQNKQKLRQAVKEVSKSIYEVRNASINGYSDVGGNVSVAIVFSTHNDENRSIEYYALPYSYTGAQLNLFNVDPNISNYKSLNLPDGVIIDSLEGSRENLVFLYEAISGDGSYYSIDKTSGDIIPLSTSPISLELSLHGSSSSTLRKELLYYSSTHIVD